MLLLSVLQVPSPGHAFTAAPTQCARLASGWSFTDTTTTTVPLTTAVPQRSTTFCAAKKKKRRRKDRADRAVDEGGADGDDDALPEFDLKDDEVSKSQINMAEESKLSGVSSKQQPQPSLMEFNPDQITPAMMAGQEQKPEKAVRDLIFDRSLERKFEFDNESETMGGEALPDLVEMMKDSSSSGRTSPAPDSLSSGADGIVGRKKARQAERRAAALAREEREREEEQDLLTDLLGGIPFLRDRETDLVTPFKIVEAGTWLAIISLISWELYINSPFFERAAPLAPIVY